SIPRCDLLEFHQFRRGVGLVLEFLDADRCQDRHDGVFGTHLRLTLGGAAEYPSEGREADHRYSDRTGRRSPQRRLYRRVFSHIRVLPVGRHARLPDTTAASRGPAENLSAIPQNLEGLEFKGSCAVSAPLNLCTAE